MSEGKLVVFLSRLFSPFAGLFPDGFLKELEVDVYQAQLPYRAREWAAYSFGLSSLVFLSFVPLFWVLFSLVDAGRPLFSAFFSALFFSAVVFLIVLFEPRQAKQRFAGEFEADMALGLQVLAIELDSGTRFREALVQASFGQDHFSRALRRVVAEERAGTPMGACLERLSASVDSVLVRRACSILKNAYRLSKGKNLGGPLLALSEEILRNNENELRVYSAKSGMFSQGATVLTIVAPTMIVSLVIIASIFTKIRFPPALFTALIGFGITLAAAVLYRIQILSLPVFVRRIGSGGFSDFGKRILLLGYASPAEYAWKAFFVALPFTLVFAVLAWGQWLLLFFFVVSLASLALLYPHVQFARVQKELENDLPVALEQAAQFTHGERVDDVMRMIAGLGLGRLSLEFEKADRELRGGARFEEALKKVGRDTGSVLMERAFSFLVRAHKTGVDVSAAMQETARYLRRITFIVQESKAATFGERATQIFGFLMSAALFAVVVSMGKSLGGLLSGTDFSPNVGMLDAVVSGIRINLVLQPFVIAWNLSELENDRKKFFTYLPLLLAGGNAIFLVFAGVQLF